MRIATHTFNKKMDCDAEEALNECLREIRSDSENEDADVAIARSYPKVHAVLGAFLLQSVPEIDMQERGL